MKNAWRSLGWGSALIVLLTIAAYLPALRGGFVWDDDDHLTRNLAVTSPGGLRLIWTSLVLPVYYPVTFTAFWLMFRTWGATPMPYHVVTLALHIANAVMLLFVLQRLKIRAAWMIAAIWAVHPVNVESVAWITELKNTLSGAFFFLTLLSYLRFERDPKLGLFMVSVLCCAAALLSKSSTVILPAVLLLCSWWQRGRVTGVDAVRSAPFFALSLADSLVAIGAQVQEKLGEGQSRDWSLAGPQRLIVAGKDVLFYVSKVLWPRHLTFVYPRWTHDVHVLAAWLPLTGAVVLGALVWRWRQTGWGRASLFGTSYFVVALLPVLGFFDQYYYRYSFVADHFQYLASIGLIGLAVSAGATLCQRTGQWGRSLGALAAAAILLMLGVSTWRQAHVYQDLETLWRDTLAKNPSAWLAHNNLGVVLKNRGKVQEAIEHYEQTLRIKPDFVEAHNNLGAALTQVGKLEDAIGHCEQALRIKPNYAEAHNNLGVALKQVGKLQEAIGHYEQALRIKPGYAEAHYNLGAALELAGKTQEAMEHYQQALRIKPDFVEAHYNLGDVLVRLGRIQEAIGHYEQALRIKPDYAEAHNNLGAALWQVGRVQEAVEHLEQALRIKPDYAEAHNNLGSALAGLGRVKEAMGHWEEALRIKPDYVEAHYNLGVALEQAGKLEDAIGHYEQALRIRPDYAEAQNRLAPLRAGQARLRGLQ